MTRALAGRRVLVTRPRAQADDLIDALAVRGAVPIPFPTIEIRPAPDLTALDLALESLESYAWIAFTSANTVEVFFDRLRRRGGEVPADVRIAAVGSGTARAVAARGARVDFVPSEFLGEQLGREIGVVRGHRVLFPKAARAREALVAELSQRGASVDEVTVYETLPAQPDQAGQIELERGVDAVTFTSASTVENFFVLLGSQAKDLVGRSVVACIGPVTSEAARGLGLPVHVEPVTHTMKDLVLALERYYAGAGLAGSRS